MLLSPDATGMLASQNARPRIALIRGCPMQHVTPHIHAQICQCIARMPDSPSDAAQRGTTQSRPSLHYPSGDTLESISPSSRFTSASNSLLTIFHAATDLFLCTYTAKIANATASRSKAHTRLATG